MPVPTLQNLQRREEAAKERLEELRQAYDNFLSTWGDIKKAEAKELQALHSHVELDNIYQVLKKIDDTPNN